MSISVIVLPLRVDDSMNRRMSCGTKVLLPPPMMVIFFPTARSSNRSV